MHKEASPSVVSLGVRQMTRRYRRAEKRLQHHKWKWLLCSEVDTNVPKWRWSRHAEVNHLPGVHPQRLQSVRNRPETSVASRTRDLQKIREALGNHAHDAELPKIEDVQQDDVMCLLSVARPHTAPRAGTNASALC